MFRAGAHAHSASYAEGCADVSNTVLNADCVAFADRFAVAEAETTERAFIAVSSFIIQHCIQCHSGNNILDSADCSRVNKGIVAGCTV